MIRSFKKLVRSRFNILIYYTESSWTHKDLKTFRWERQSSLWLSNISHDTPPHTHTQTRPKFIKMHAQSIRFEVGQSLWSREIFFYSTSRKFIGKFVRVCDTINTFKVSQDKFWFDQEMVYDHKADLSGIFMKLFRTNNIDAINYCRTQFNFALPSVLIEQCSRKFVVNYRLCDNVFCKTSFCWFEWTDCTVYIVIVKFS